MRRNDEAEPTMSPPNLGFPLPTAAVNSLASRVPFPVWGLTACALFLIVGVAVLDDYGISWDEFTQRYIAEETAAYALGDGIALVDDLNKFYGAAFELPLLLVERVLGLEDTRSIFLSRHILTHLFFIVGGFFCCLLAYRLSNSRLVALFALLLFLLHPRLYAHSFFNTKDIPFLSMFMIALYLTHRAFSRDAVRAFLLLGAAVGILVNLRIMGVMLFAAILVMRGVDLLYASGREERKRILTTGGLFALAGALTFYATLPYLWANPIGRFAEMLAVLSQHPNYSFQLFQGDLILATELPWRYIPTWFAITTPPVALLLGLIGTAALVYRAVTGPGDVLRNTPLRFGFLLIACFALPILAVILLESNTYDGWRHMYFLYAPFCLLAALGLHQLAPLRAGVYGLAGIGLGIVIIQMTQIHPYQHVYFNFLVDRRTPEYLRSQYDMEYWGTSVREGLEYLLERYPSSPYIYVWKGYNNSGVRRNWNILPEADRRRIVTTSYLDADFYITFHREHVGGTRTREDLSHPVIYTRKVYDNTIMSVTTRNPSLLDAAPAERYREIWRTAYAGEPAISSDFDVHLRENTLVYTKEPCARADTEAMFFLHLYPVDAADLPDHRKQYGFDNLDFDFDRRGVIFDGRCMAKVALPEYAIARIGTGQYVSVLGGFHNFWEVEMRLDDGVALIVNAKESKKSLEAALRSDYETLGL